MTASGGKASFGFAGGVRQGAFWGDLEYQDYELGLRMEGTGVTGYSATGPKTRVIQGTARTNLYGNRVYRITATDHGGTFQIDLDNGYSRQGPLLSGKIRLHKGNRNSTPPPGYACVVPLDTTAPTVMITFPSSGSTLSGTVAVTASASDDGDVAGVQFQLDGAPLGPEDTTAPYSVSWDTATSPDGSHSLTAVARDGAGNTATSAPVSVNVSNGATPPGPDTTPPSVTITYPGSGSTVSGTITVTANASDNVRVAGVQFTLDGAPLGPEATTAPYSATWYTTMVSNGSHTLAAVASDAAGNTATSSPVTVTVSNVPYGRDVLVSLTTGQVEWRNPDGSLRQLLIGTSTGQASSLNFDAGHDVYVPHWYPLVQLAPGNTVERFDANGNLRGTFGMGYNCNPSSIVFDGAGNAYVGQADCTGDLLKFDPAGNLVASFAVAMELRGTDHIDLAGDGCTIFYTSRTVNVLRYNVCTRTQLPNFNRQPLPGSTAYHVRILPDGGVLVADAGVIARLDGAGTLVQTYNVPGESGYLWGGVDFAGDGTFWASNGYNSNVYRFDLQTGAVLIGFKTGTGDNSAAGVAVKR